jgi:hypothetical protein
MGFTIWERSSVLLTSSGSNTSVTFRSPSDLSNGSAPYATDNSAALFWSAPLMIAACGNVEVYNQSEAPEYYGSIVSTLLRIGGKNARSGSDYFGVGAIVQSS